MVFKSAKVPSVLLGARWINRTGLTARELFWALCMMSGLLLFALGDGLESARFTVLGIVFIAVNLAGSTLTANLQQSVLQPSASVATPAPSVRGLMLVQYATASVVLFLQTSVTGECSDAVRWYLRNRSAAFYTCLDNVLTYLGLEAVMCITQEFDATRANVVCSGRKAITFVFSYFFFPKPFSMLHVFGLFLTILGGWSLQQAKWHEKKTAGQGRTLSARSARPYSHYRTLKLIRSALLQLFGTNLGQRASWQMKAKKIRMMGIDAPSFGIAEAVATFDSTMQSTGSLGRTEAERPGAVEDELSNAASVDKVQEVTEQLAEFLVKFSSDEQYAILTPFLSMLDTGDEFVEPHIDEARKFICHYLAVFSQCERDLILEKWRPAFDTASLNSATESLTPSVTPPGSVTPTVVTPREFLSARREVNEVYHSHSPCGEAERS
ncbi:SLC35B3 [Symbiodinium necroappetens]|uniref:SLC35B3 protein n=1 Tax=Symbiodinium necroappetens TaxID=1628268 RepID=A0A812N1V0_9DINO|nr:SLC35B3 [Symbiodinium necroappetens]